VKEDKIMAKIEKNRTMMSKIRVESIKDKKEKYFLTIQKAKNINRQIE
jgi:hypothetical protein